VGRYHAVFTQTALVSCQGSAATRDANERGRMGQWLGK